METLIASLELYMPVYFLTKLYFSCNLIKICRIIAGVVQGLSTSLQVLKYAEQKMDLKRFEYMTCTESARVHLKYANR